MTERRLPPPVLPSFLQRTEEQVWQDDEAQVQRRASFTRAKLSEEEKLQSRGSQIEEIARANIVTMEALREEGERISTQGGANLEMLSVEYSKLAYGLELQGRYLEAAGFHPLKREQERLKKIHEAIKKPDVPCDCPRSKERDPLSGEELSISPRRTLKTIYSRDHGQAVSLTECLKCGTWNAMPRRGQAAAILASAEGTASGRSGAVRAVPDAQLLKA